MHGTFPLLRCCTSCRTAKGSVRRCTCPCGGTNHGTGLPFLTAPTRSAQLSFAEFDHDPREPSLFDVVTPPRVARAIAGQPSIGVSDMNAMTPTKAAQIVEAVLIRGDLAALTPDERSKYYVRMCESIGLNPLTKPFEYLTLNGKLVLYALKAASDQLRTLHKVSVTELTESERDGLFIVTAKVENGEGRRDAAKGAVFIDGLRGEVLANAIMKAETKAKRRATLSICGLGFLDESEVEDIPAEVKAQTAAQQKPKTLPKKDARQIAGKLDAEFQACADLRALDAWRAAAAERIAVLPEDWQDHLQLRIDERRLEFRQHQAAEMPEREIIWDEAGERSATAGDETVITLRPAKPRFDTTDHGGVPAFLDRRATYSQEEMMSALMATR